MTATQVVLLVVGILGFNAAIQVTIWTLVFRKLRRIAAELPEELTAAGDRIVQGPERITYAGATADYPRARGLAVLVLTDRRLFCRRVGGKSVELAISDIREVAAARRWIIPGGGYRIRSGSQYVICKTKSGAEVGFSIKDASHGAWIDAIVRAGVKPAA